MKNFRYKKKQQQQKTKNKKKTKKKKTDIFHISVQTIDCRYSLEPPRRGGSNEYPQSMFLSRNKKNNVYLVNPSFAIQKWGLWGSTLYRHVFIMALLFAFSAEETFSHDAAEMQLLSTCIL